MGNNLTLSMELYFQPMALLCNLGDTFRAEARRSGRGIGSGWKVKARWAQSFTGSLAAHQQRHHGFRRVEAVFGLIEYDGARTVNH